MNNDGVTDFPESTSDVAACPPGVHGYIPTCSCAQMKQSYGALDLGAWLYNPTNLSAAPQTTSSVFGLPACTLGAMRATPLFGDFNGDSIVDAVMVSADPNDTTDAAPRQVLDMYLGAGSQSFVSGGAITIPAGVHVFETLDADLDGVTDLVARTVPTYTAYSWKNNAWQVTPVPIGEDPLKDNLLLSQAYMFESGDTNGDNLDDFIADNENGLYLYQRNYTTAKPDFSSA